MSNPTSEAEAEPEAESEVFQQLQHVVIPEAEENTQILNISESESFISSAESEAISELSSQSETILWVTLYVVCIIFILAGDVLILVAICRQRSMRQRVANLYLASLIAARTLIGVFVVPSRITGTFSEEFMGSMFCKLCHFSALASSATSVLSVLTIALTMYRENMKANINLSAWQNQTLESGMRRIARLILTPPQNESTISLQKTYLHLILLWFIGFVYAIRAPFLYDLVVVSKDLDPRISCTIPDEFHQLNLYFTILDLICLFTLPVCAIVYCYVRIILLIGGIWRLQEDIHTSSTSVSLRTAQRESSRTSQMLIAIMSLFIICSMPPYVLKLYSLSTAHSAPIPSVLEEALYLASYSNSWINVLVYLAFREDLRHGVLGLLCARRCCSCCHHQTPTSTISASCTETSLASLNNVSSAVIEMNEPSQTITTVEI